MYDGGGALPCLSEALGPDLPEPVAERKQGVGVDHLDVDRAAATLVQEVGGRESARRTYERVAAAARLHGACACEDPANVYTAQCRY